MTIKINFKTTGAVALGLGAMLALTACGGGTTDTRDLGSDTQPTAGVETPAPAASETATPDASATPAQTDVAFEDDARWGIDPTTVEIPDEVQEAYGDSADTLVFDALVALNEGYVAPVELHTGGYEAETYNALWNAFAEDFITSRLTELVGDDATLRDVLMPVTMRSGEVFTLDGVKYTAKADWTALMDRNIVVGLDADGRATVAAQLVVDFDTDPEPVSMKRNVTLAMVPTGEGDDARWLIDNATYETLDIEVG